MSSHYSRPFKLSHRNGERRTQTGIVHQVILVEENNSPIISSLPLIVWWVVNLLFTHKSRISSPPSPSFSSRSRALFIMNRCEFLIIYNCIPYFYVFLSPLPQLIYTTSVAKFQKRSTTFYHYPELRRVIFSKIY